MIYFLTFLLGISLSLGVTRIYAQGTAPTAAQVPLSGRTLQSGSVSSVQTPIPGLTSSVNTLNTSVQVQGPYTGSIPSRVPLLPGAELTLRDAITRALEANLGGISPNNSVRQLRGQERVARSSLLPNISAALRENVQQVNLAALGVRVPFVPQIAGPFNYFDLRATLTQNLADFTALNNYRSAKESSRAAEFFAKDARDLVVLAVAGSYLQAVAAAARIESAKSQIETAEALLKQTSERRAVGLSAQIDVNRSQVELQSERQRLNTLQNDLAKQKINLARITGLATDAQFSVGTSIAFSALPELALQPALAQAFENRADMKAAEAQVRAAERTRAAARAELLPSLSVSADYGAIGTNPAQSHGTFTVVGTLRVPIWQGGRTQGNIDQAEAALEQRRAEQRDLRGRIEADVRSAFLDLQSAEEQIATARSNIEVARETLKLTRQRLDAGIAEAVEVVQAQQDVAIADFDYVSSLFAHNLAKVSLARAIGNAEVRVPEFLKLP